MMNELGKQLEAQTKSLSMANDTISELLQEREELKAALNKIIRTAPANGEDCSYLIARRAMLEIEDD